MTFIISANMGNDSSKLQPHPATKVQRRLSTDSCRRYQASPVPLPASNSSISCSDSYLNPKGKLVFRYRILFNGVPPNWMIGNSSSRVIESRTPRGSIAENTVKHLAHNSLKIDSMLKHMLTGMLLNQNHLRIFYLKARVAFRNYYGQRTQQSLCP